MKFYIAVLIAACAGAKHNVVPKEPPCVSQCGMLLETRGNGSIDCQSIDDAEELLLSAIDKHFCSTYHTHCKEYACGQIFGWQVEADTASIMVTDVMATTYGNDGGVLQMPLRIPVSGLAKCSTKQVWLGSSDNWRKGSYPHELLHIIQDCEGPGIETEEDSDNTAGHEGWTEGGFYKFLEMVRAGEI